MAYVLANWVSSEEGFRPDLPENCSFRCLAGSSKNQTFGLFEITDFSDDQGEGSPRNAVPGSLAVLLDSCRAYPPALASAARDLATRTLMSPQDFNDELEQRLTEQLESQRSRPYVMAKSRASETGYRDVGEFVWIVAYNPKRVGQEITWVSSDYQLYSDSIVTFDIDSAWLAKRFDWEE